MSDVATEIEVRRQAEAGETPAPVDGEGLTDDAVETATAEEAVAGRAEEADEDERDGGVVHRGRSAVGQAEQLAAVAGQVGDQVEEAVGRAGDAVERAAAASGRVASAVVERLRNNAELAAERGLTRIADEVVEKIAGIAARDVPGVYDLGGDVARIFASLKERIGLGDADDDADRGMQVRLEGGTAQVNVTLVIEYGFVVHSVTEKVRAKVISAVENLLGLEVTEVNILVDDVHVPDDARPVD